jgi:hypothetical protein
MAVKVGFQIDTEELESLVPSSAEMSIIGAIVTAPAKTSGIEFNKLYAVNSDDKEFFTALGVTGTGQATMLGVGKQLGQMSRSTRMVVNVVAEGTGSDAQARALATIANMVGNAVAGTGIHAFKKAGTKVNRTPRILIAPGYTSQRTGNTANALCAEFATVCETMLAVACVTGPATTRQAALDWRETIESKRIIPTETDLLVADTTTGVPIHVPSDAYIAGLINRVDELHGGLPFHSAGNRSLYGVLGPSRDIDFSLTDEDSEGQELLNADLGIIVRGEGGDDFALAEGGTLYMGVSTASNDPLWQYYNQVRGRDWIHLTLLRTLRALLAKYNLTGRLVQVYMNTIRDVLTRLAAEERIHKDFRVDLIPSLNTPADLRAGQLTVKMAVEEPSPFLRGVIKSSRYEYALSNFIGQLAAQVNQVDL